MLEKVGPSQGSRDSSNSPDAAVRARDPLPVGIGLACSEERRSAAPFTARTIASGEADI